MSFAETITLTIDTVDHVLIRINQDNFGSEYRYSGTTSSISMKVRHSTDSVDKDGISMLRHNVFVERVIFPTATELMKKESFTMTLRGGKYEDVSLSSDLADAAVTWAASGTILADLAAGVN